MYVLKDMPKLIQCLTILITLFPWFRKAGLLKGSKCLMNSTQSRDPSKETEARMALPNKNLGLSSWAPSELPACR